MRKNLLLLVAAFLFAASYLNAQVMYSDDFESYTVGNGIAEEEGDWWDTWTGAPGTAEDPTVSDAFAYEGTQSVLVSGTNDGVIEFADLTEGRYRVEFYIMVPAGRQGYWNIMQNFNPSGSGLVWGMQIFMKDGLITIDGAGEGAATHSFTHGEWVKVQHFIDLNSDWVDLYINDELVHAYQWSRGTFDNGTGINKLDAFNFYAWGEGGTPEYYMDNFLIEEVETPYSPLNFNYTLENGNDVVLTWEAPTEGTPESYTVARNGVVLGTTTELTYTDLNVYPNTYDYSLLAFYGTSSGYSSPLVVEVPIEGGNERNLVVFEMFTSVNCVYCPYAAQAIDMLEAEGLDVAIIEYHGDGLGADPYTIAETTTRDAFYFALYPDDDPLVTSYGYPTTIFNGTDAQIGAITNVADQNSVYDYYYEEQIDIPSVYDISSWIEPVSTDPYLFNVHIDVEETFPYFSDETRLMITLTETNIPESWQGGLTEVNFVARDMYPDGNGTVLDFSTETTYSTVVPITIDPTWVVDNCEVVIYVQNMVTGHIQQAKKHGLFTFVNSEIEKTFETTIYPNPAADIINVFASEKIENVEVLNMAGQVITSLSNNTDTISIDVNDFASGVYFVKVYTQGKVSTHKVIVE